MLIRNFNRKILHVDIYIFDILAVKIHAGSIYLGLFILGLIKSIYKSLNLNERNKETSG